MAIPAEFRTKPKKTPKTHKLHYDLVSYEVIKDLERGLPYHDKKATSLHYEYKEPPTDPTISVMERLGAVSTVKGVWEFAISSTNNQRTVAHWTHTRSKNHQFYPTPELLAAIAVGIADIEPHHACLEPSAGQGGLADLMPKSTTCIEVSELHCAVLKAKGYQVEQTDFLTYGYGRVFDRIVMNPPFQKVALWLTLNMQLQCWQ